MKRSQRMDKIADINLGFENLAGAKLAIARNTYLKEEHQLEQLCIYKSEYQEKLKQRLQEQITPTEMMDYQYFFDSLDNAIAQQREIVEKNSALLEESRQNWLSQKQEASKYQRASQKIRQQEAAADDYKEQKEADEQVQISHSRKK